MFYHSLELEGSFTAVTAIIDDQTQVIIICGSLIIPCINSFFCQKFNSPQIEEPLSSVDGVTVKHKVVKKFGFICQFCNQSCKNKAGLLAHQRQSKVCKQKQFESKYITKIDVNYRRNSEL